MDKKYKIERDIYGYAEAISLGGYFVLQLIPGSTRNEENIEKIVELLNGNSSQPEKQMVRIPKISNGNFFQIKEFFLLPDS